MKTKLVYVLTCAPEASYIEQALMAVWSSRYHNPDAHIVLLMDDLTDKLLVGTRGELLNYISEKIVVPFEDETLTPMYRSRWIKTSVRNLIAGDYLFIDCDTITMCDLSLIEQINVDIAMVRDENINIADEDYASAKPMIDNCHIVGIDITKEKYYFNSGVMYVKDTAITHKLYTTWHQFWKEGVERGVNLDQPTFAKANIECGRPVVLMEDRWNAIVKTQIAEIYSAYILHFWHSVSFLYFAKCMNYIREKGLTDWIKYYILHPTYTFLPADNRVYHYRTMDYFHFYRQLKRALKDYGTHIDSTYPKFGMHMSSEKFVMWCLAHRLVGCAAWLVVLSKMYRVKCSRKFKYFTNHYEKANIIVR